MDSERERMRRVLATKAMGWRPSSREHLGVWEDATGHARALRVMWDPFADPKQMMDVIEAMREKGWQWEIEDGYENGFVRVTLTDAMGDGPDVFDEDECYARMLAAFRALEATDD